MLSVISKRFNALLAKKENIELIFKRLENLYYDQKNIFESRQLHTFLDKRKGRIANNASFTSIEKIIRHGADPGNKDLYGDTVLHKMANNIDTNNSYHCKALELFIQHTHPTEIDCTDSNGKTALHTVLNKTKRVSVNNAWFTIIKEFINHGADPVNKDLYGDTVLHKMAKNIDINNPDHCKALELFIQHTLPIQIDCTDLYGYTAFHIFLDKTKRVSANNAWFTIIKEFINHGADPVNKDLYGNTVLHKMANNIDINNPYHCKALELFIQHTLPIQIDCTDLNGKTALHIVLDRTKRVSANSAWFTIIKEFINHGADPVKKDLYGNTALHKMANNIDINNPYHCKALKLFIQHTLPIQIDCTDSNGKTAFSYFLKNASPQKDGFEQNVQRLQIINLFLNKGSHFSGFIVSSSNTNNSTSDTLKVKIVQPASQSTRLYANPIFKWTSISTISGGVLVGALTLWQRWK